MLKKYCLLLLIILLAIIFRFWNLGNNPPSLTWDETAWGYNAYSLGIDGKDEFGRFLPVDYLESFGDFKPVLYAYLDILPIKFFGLNEFAVRFPSALFGVLTVVITFFLTRRIFSNKILTQTEKKIDTDYLALASALFLAISPWHINLSRAAFEANIATFFLVCGVWLFLSGVQNKKRYLTISIVSFVLSVYTFNTARVVAPLLFLGLLFGFRKQLLTQKAGAIIAIIVGLLLILPAFQFLLSPQASLRFKEVNIFSDVGIIEKTNREIINDGNIWWSKILHNRRFAYSVEFLRHYFDNFNPNFLFIKGDGNPKFSTQDIGQLYVWEIPFFTIGVFFLFKKREKSWWIIPFWLAIGIIPSATARETPHALRIETTLPTFQIIVAYGAIIIFSIISNLKSQISNLKIKYLIFTICFLFLIFNILYYFHGYYAHYSKEYSGEWQYGYKDAIYYIRSVEKDYDKVYFTDSLGRPYIYLLFYTKFDPREFRKNSVVEREAFGFVHVKNFYKYVFPEKSMAIKTQAKEKRLYIDVSGRIPDNANIKNTFYLLNKNIILIAYTL